MFFSLFLLFAATSVAAQASHVALVDFAPVAMAEPGPNHTYTRGEARSKIIMPNLNAMATLVAEAVNGSSAIKMVVFPEDGLYGPDFPTRASVFPFLEALPAPSPTLGAACHDASAGLVLQFVSCLAQKYQVFLVLDMGEVDGAKQYNTAIAVNPQGVLVARYRKQHLYFEPQFDAGPLTDPSTGIFDTPFGRVGLCVCFDVLFPNVWHRMQSNDVDFVVAPTWWVNLPPLGVSTGMHTGVARALNKTVLVAGVGLNWANSGTVAVTGSGRVLAQHYNPSWKAQTTIVTAPLLSDDSKVQSEPVSAVQAAPSSPTVACVLCETIVSFVEHRLPSNATVEEVESLLNHTLCVLLPSKLRMECEAFLEEMGSELASTLHRYEEQYPTRTVCDSLGMCGLLVFEAEAHTSGSVGSSSSCVASYSFGANVLKGERFGLMSFVGPYGPPGEIIYNLSSCAVVRCASNKRFKCASVYTEGAPIMAASVFDSLSVSYQPSALFARPPMSWITDGNYTVVPQSSGLDANGTHTIATTSPSTITSAAFWILIPVGPADVNQ